MDDLDRILGSYGSVAEYFRSMSEETYEEHLQSEKLEKLEREIEEADDTVQRWDRVTAWDETDHVYDHLLTEKEKLVIELDEYRTYLTWGTYDDMHEWIDRGREDRTLDQPAEVQNNEQHHRKESKKIKR